MPATSAVFLIASIGIRVVAVVRTVFAMSASFSGVSRCLEPVMDFPVYGRRSEPSGGPQAGQRGVAPAMRPRQRAESGPHRREMARQAHHCPSRVQKKCMTGSSRHVFGAGKVTTGPGVLAFLRKSFDGRPCTRTDAPRPSLSYS